MDSFYTTWSAAVCLAPRGHIGRQVEQWDRPLFEAFREITQDVIDNTKAIVAWWPWPGDDATPGVELPGAAGRTADAVEDPRSRKALEVARMKLSPQAPPCTACRLAAGARSWPHSLLQNIGTALAECTNDLGWDFSTVASMMLVLIHPGIPVASPHLDVVMCGIAVPMKFVTLVFVGCTTMAAESMWSRFPRDGPRVMQKRSCMILSMCTTYHLWILMGGLPSFITAHVAHPWLMSHCILDMICSPPLLLNLGLLAGNSPDQMLHIISMTSVGFASYAVAAAVHVPIQSYLAVGFGCGCLVEAGFELCFLPATAAPISRANMVRTQMSGDLILFSWISFGLIHILGLSNLLPDSMQLAGNIACDAVGKIGVCHIMLKSREALRFSIAHTTENNED